jgi:PAS domain S-box-containing protein
VNELPASALKQMGAEVEGALEQVNVPSYVIDGQGVIRWVNAAGRRIVGDVVGKQFTSIVAPEETLKAREIFARRILGNAGDASVVVVDTSGANVSVELSAVPLRRGDRIIGVFGQVADIAEEVELHPELHLTPRQAEILRLLEHGRSTLEIAEELHLSRETVRNHVRHLLRAMGANSRLEAVALARGGRLKH